MVTSRIWFTPQQKAELWERWEGDRMKVRYQGDKVFNVATGNEMRMRWTPQVLVGAAIAAVGWYLFPITRHIAIELGVGRIVSAIAAPLLVIGAVVLVLWLFDKRFGKRPMPDWLIRIIAYEVKPRNPK